MNVSSSILPSVHPFDLLALFPGLRHVAHVVQVVVAQLRQSLGRHGDLLVLSSHVNGQIFLYFIVDFPKVVRARNIQGLYIPKNHRQLSSKSEITGSSVMPRTQNYR